jgi:hypothetical protein
VIRSLRIPFIIAVAVACSVDQPLPPPNNPLTATKLCAYSPDPTIDTCTRVKDGTRCHVAIGGGACADDCSLYSSDPTTTPDAYCSGLVDGYVCHNGLGVCGPACTATINGVSGDRVCAALAPNLSCQTNGQCISSPPSQTAFVRLFNASLLPDMTLAPSGLGVQINATQSGQLSAEATLPAGAFDFVVADASGPRAHVTKTLASGQHYIVIFFPLLGGQYDVMFVDAAQPGTPNPDNPWITYRQLVPGLVPQDVAINGQPVLSAVDFRTMPDPIQVAPGMLGVSFAVGPSPAKPPTMVGTAALAMDRSYVIVSWVGDNVLPETAILGAVEGVVARFSPAGLRLANAVYDTVSGLTAALDGLDVLDNQHRTTTSPPGGYMLVAPGTHRLSVRSGPTFLLPDSNVTLTGGRHYAVIAYGKAADLSAPLTARVLIEDPPVSPAAGKIAVRLMHVAASPLFQPATVDLAAGPAMSQATVVSLVAYGDVQPFPAFAEVPLVSPMLLTATFSVTPVPVSGKVTLNAEHALTVIATESAAGQDLMVLDDRGGIRLALP